MAVAAQRQAIAYQRTAAQTERAVKAQALAHAFLRILNLHRVEFPPAMPPVAPAPAAPDRGALYRHFEAQALHGLGMFQRAERAAAKQRAIAWTEAEAMRQWAAVRNQQEQWQRYLDDRWRQLCGNVPDVVVETLNEAFEDNEAPSAAVDVVEGEASLVVLVPPVDEVVPEQMPGKTAAGNLSIRKLSQRDRADYYTLFVNGQVLVTVREAFAVAPGLLSTRVVVLRNDGRDAYGRPRVSCILAARFTRAALNGVQWESADSVRIVNDVSSERLANQRARTNELTPIDLEYEPALATLVKMIDVEELTAG